MTWAQARIYARQGVRVRRREWGDRWITWRRGLYYLQPVDYLLQDGPPRVVRSADFEAAEFLAADWTIDPIPPGPDSPAIYPTRLFFESLGDYQDDDVRIRVGGVTVSDTQWNVGWYYNETYVGPGGNPDYATLGFRKIDLSRAQILTAGAVFEAGSLVEIDVFDGWAGSWKTAPWQVLIEWNDGDPTFGSGGSNTTGTSIEPIPSPVGAYYSEGPHFEDYIPNGSFVITAPES